MTRISVSYTSIETRHPEELERLARDIRSTKSGMRKIPHDQMKWEYSYSVWSRFRIGKEFMQRAPEGTSIDDQVRDLIRETDVFIIASHPSKKQMQSFGVKLNEMPAEVIAHIRADIMMKEQIRDGTKAERWTGTPS